MTVEIYVLRHPETFEIRYVGKANDSKKRLLTHLQSARHRKTPVYSWIRSLSSPPIMEVVCTVSPERWREEEKRIIEQHRNNGTRLLNLALGGDEPFCSIEQRRKNAKRLVEWSVTDPANKARRAANGRKVSLVVHSDPVRKRIWSVKRELAQRLWRLLKEREPSDALRRTLLTCMALGDFYPNTTPNKWRALRWDEDFLGPLSKDVMESLMPKSLLCRFDMSDEAV